MGVSNLIKELSFLLFSGIFCSCALSLLSVELFTGLSVLLDLHLNDCELLVAILNLLFDRSII